MAADRRPRDLPRDPEGDQRPELVVAPDAAFEPDREGLAALAAGRVSHDDATFDPELTREFWGDELRVRRRRGSDAPARPRQRSADRTRAVRATRELRWSSRGAEQHARRPPDPLTRRTGPVPGAWADGRPPAPPDATRPPDESDGSEPGRQPDGVLGLGAVDPLLRRLGAIVMVGVLAVPVALALRPSGEEAGMRAIAAGERADVLRLPTVARAAVGTGIPTTGNDPGGSPGPAEPIGSEAIAETSVEPGPAVEPGCALEYTIVPGDYWLRLADGAGVTLADLFAVNGASVDSVIHPGDRICLPEGAATPPPPPTTTTTTTPPATTPPATTPPATTPPVSSPSASQTGSSAPAPRSTTPPTTSPGASAPTTSAPTSSAPATTAAPAPIRPPSSSNPSADAVRAIIREVFPAEQHEMAITVARRESNFRANAYNGWCCHGVFQIHWSAHRGWLGEMGITSVEQLYDARTNIEVAYRIYQRAGGWGPWRQTAY